MSRDTTLRPGDIGLVNIVGDVGFLIRLAQWLNGDMKFLGGFFKSFWRGVVKKQGVSHAFIYTGPDGPLVANIVEAEPGGAKRGNYHEYSDVVWSSGLFNLTDAQRTAIVNSAVGFLGTPYSFLDYLSLALKRFHIPFPWLNAYIRSDKHVICSQLVAACYYDAGAAFWPQWTGDCDPEDIAKVFADREAALAKAV